MGGTSINLLLLREAERRGEDFDSGSRILYKRVGRYFKVNLEKEFRKRSIWASELPFKNFESVTRDMFKIVLLRNPIDKFNSYREMRANTQNLVWNDHRSSKQSVERKLINSHKSYQCKYVSARETSCGVKDVLKNWDLVLLFEEFHSSVALICVFLEISEKDCCLPLINRRRV